MKLIELKNSQVASIRVHSNEEWDKWKKLTQFMAVNSQYVLRTLHEHETALGGFSSAISRAEVVILTCSETGLSISE